MRGAERESISITTYLTTTNITVHLENTNDTQKARFMHIQAEFGIVVSAEGMGGGKGDEDLKQAVNRRSRSHRFLKRLMQLYVKLPVIRAFSKDHQAFSSRAAVLRLSIDLRRNCQA